MFARAIWQRIETLHAVTYFSPESIDAAKQAGLRGFWMGYFGFRAAPLGPIGPAAIEAAFANFAPAMVRRSLPDAWSFASADALIPVRAEAAATALRSVVPDIDAIAAVVNDELARVVAAADPLGRVLFAANRDLSPRSDPVEQLWQHCTTLREHRGDGHVATLSAAGVDGCAAHLLHTAEHGTAPEVVFEHRGWSTEDRADAVGRLRDGGLLDADGRLTDVGIELRHSIESATDRSALRPYELALSTPERNGLLSTLTPAATAVVEAGALPFPNPMGLPRPGLT
ncbi:MAG: hypothetical protein AAFP84_15580 [Actinomycetota bacterium]